MDASAKRKSDCEEELLDENQTELNVPGGVGEMSPLLDRIETEMKGEKGGEGERVGDVGDWRPGKGKGEGGGGEWENGRAHD